MNRDVQAYMVLAIARYHLGHPAQARAAITTGLAIAQDGLPGSDTELANWRDWNDWIIARVLMDEARGLIEGSPGAGKTPGQLNPDVVTDQQQRVALMKSRGPEASFTVLPVRLAGKPFDRVTEVVGVLLEEMGGSSWTCRIRSTPTTRASSRCPRRGAPGCWSSVWKGYLR